MGYCLGSVGGPRSPALCKISKVPRAALFGGVRSPTHRLGILLGARHHMQQHATAFDRKAPGRQCRSAVRRWRAKKCGDYRGGHGAALSNATGFRMTVALPAVSATALPNRANDRERHFRHRPGGPGAADGSHEATKFNGKCDVREAVLFLPTLSRKILAPKAASSASEQTCFWPSTCFSFRSVRQCVL